MFGMAHNLPVLSGEFLIINPIRGYNQFICRLCTLFVSISVMESCFLRSHGDMRTKESSHCRVYGWSSNNTHLKSTYIPVCWYRVVHMTGPNQRNRYAPWSTSTSLYIRHQAPSLHIIESLSRIGPWKLTSHQVFTKTGHFWDLQRARGCRSPAREGKLRWLRHLHITAWRSHASIIQGATLET